MLTIANYCVNIAGKKGEMKMKNLKVFISSVMAAVTMGSGMSVVADAKSANSNKKQSYVYIYDDSKDLKKEYGIEQPIELIMPISVEEVYGEYQKYEYGTVTVEYDKNSINPTELVNVLSAMQTLNAKDDSKEFVYCDSNNSKNEDFRTKTSTKKYTKNELTKYISKQTKKIEAAREKIDHSKYAEFILPVMGNYKYKSANGKSAVYRQIEYIYFYMPYDQISNDTDFSKLATLVYERYQSTFDHVVTYSELQKEDSKHKEPVLAKTK